MTRRQLHELAMAVGTLLALLAFAFSTSALIRWWWGAPMTVLGAVLLGVGLERRSADKRLRRKAL